MPKNYNLPPDKQNELPSAEQPIDSTSPVSRLLGIAAAGGHVSVDQAPTGNPTGPDPEVLQQGLKEAVRRQKQEEVTRRQYKKCDAIRRYISPESTVTSSERLQLSNIENMTRNRGNLCSPHSDFADELHNYIFAKQSVDPYEVADVGIAYARSILKDVSRDSFDIPDLVFASRMADGLYYDTIIRYQNDGLQVDSLRGNAFQQAYRMALIHALPREEALYSHVSVGLKELYKRILSTKGDLPQRTNVDFERYEMMLWDRLRIPVLIQKGGLWTVPGDTGSSAYARPPKAGELEQLNRNAAETMERLHLLKEYGVTPFEVTAKQTQFPFDIAVMPPLDNALAEAPEHAPAAVADFLILNPNEQRDSILIKADEESRGQSTIGLSLGNEPVHMRFRLHDDGSISYGLYYHNTPTHFAQMGFEDYHATPAFERMRALFIALAFDAVVPADVVNSGRVGGTVANALYERAKDPLHKRINKLLLQRSRVLREAGITPESRRPEGWERPAVMVGVRGCQPKLPAGARPRPSAEAEAREYYESMGVAFAGLKAGHTFRKPYSQVRGTLGEPVPVTYRRAYFRPGSQTASFLKNQR